MAKSKRGELPEVLFVAPIGGGKEKRRHQHCLFVVEEWDAQGRPLHMRLCQPDEVFAVEAFTEAGGEFITGYLQAKVLMPHPEKVNKRMTDRDAGRVHKL